MIREKALLVTINRLYRPGMSGEELYEATRGVWRLGPQRDEVELVMAVHGGIVLEVYRVRAWHPAGTLLYRTREDIAGYIGTGRWEFEGEVASDIRDRYVGRRHGTSGQNPVRYETL